MTDFPYLCSFDRSVTVLLYLTDVDEGGDTVFSSLGKSVKPSKGTALMWRNMFANGTCDSRTMHLSRPVKRGSSTDQPKIILQRWYHNTSTGLLNFVPGPPPMPEYDMILPKLADGAVDWLSMLQDDVGGAVGAPVVACDGVHMCRQYDHWIANWINWKGYDWN